MAVLKPNFVGGQICWNRGNNRFCPAQAVAEEVRSCGAEPVLYEVPGTEFDREATYTILGVEHFCAENGIRIVRLDPEGNEQDWVELRPAGAKAIAAASASPVSCKKPASLTCRCSRHMSSRP